MIVYMNEVFPESHKEKYKSYSPPLRNHIDLTSSAGNAFHLMALADQYMIKTKTESEERSLIINNMKSGSYQNLLAVMEYHFGNVFILELPDDFDVDKLEECINKYEQSFEEDNSFKI